MHREISQSKLHQINSTSTRFMYKYTHLMRNVAIKGFSRCFFFLSFFSSFFFLLLLLLVLLWLLLFRFDSLLFSFFRSVYSVSVFRYLGVSVCACVCGVCVCIWSVCLSRFVPLTSTENVPKCNAQHIRSRRPAATAVAIQHQNTAILNVVSVVWLEFQPIQIEPSAIDISAKWNTHGVCVHWRTALNTKIIAFVQLSHTDTRTRIRLCMNSIAWFQSHLTFAHRALSIHRNEIHFAS